MNLRDEAEFIGQNGRPMFGIYRAPLSIINLEQLRSYGKSSPRFTSSALRAFHLKRWQYLGICNDDIIFGMAVVDLGYLSNLFYYLFDRRLKEITEYKSIHPFGLNTQIEGSSVSGNARFKGKAASVEINNRARSVELTFYMKNKNKGNVIFNLYEEPLSIVTRAGRSGFNYTHKEAGITVAGELQFNGKKYVVARDDSYGVLDYTVGFFSGYTFWNWASGGGLDTRGRRIGFNFAAGLNETGFTENVFWIDGRIFKADLVDFQYDDLDLNGPWKIVSNDNKVNLTFYPEGERKAHLNLGIIKSRFYQPFGRFEGYLRDDNLGCEIRQASGFTEEHEARW